MSTSNKEENKIIQVARGAALLLFAVLLTAALMTGCGSDSGQRRDGSVRIGVTLYDQYDTFLSELMDSFNGYVDARKAEGVDIVTVRQDAAGSQSLQNDEVAEMIENGCSVICVNLVDRTEPTDHRHGPQERCAGHLLQQGTGGRRPDAVGQAVLCRR